jgi:hypothetical protein
MHVVNSFGSIEFSFSYDPLKLILIFGLMQYGPYHMNPHIVFSKKNGGLRYQYLFIGIDKPCFV